MCIEACPLPKSSNEDPIYDVQTNLIGTLKILELAVKHKIKKIIFPSSGGTVYGIPTQTPIQEFHSTNPICSYGITKLAIEKYLQLFYLLHQLDYCVLRISNPYGEGQRIQSTQGAIAVFIGKMLKGETISNSHYGKNAVKFVIYKENDLHGNPIWRNSKT